MEVIEKFRDGSCGYMALETIEALVSEYLEETDTRVQTAKKYAENVRINYANVEIASDDYLCVDVNLERVIGLAAGTLTLADIDKQIENQCIDDLNDVYARLGMKYRKPHE